MLAGYNCEVSLEDCTITLSPFASIPDAIEIVEIVCGRCTNGLSGDNTYSLSPDGGWVVRYYPD